MRYYEIVFILNINKDNNYSNLINIILSKFINISKNIKDIKIIGLKKLSYPIKKTKKAFYIIYNIKCNVEEIKKIEKEIKLNNFIIRYIILKK